MASNPVVQRVFDRMLLTYDSDPLSWTQQASRKHREDGKGVAFCISGCQQDAAAQEGLLMGEEDYYKAEHPNMLAWLYLREALYRRENHDYRSDVVGWNDDKGRTFEDIIALIKEAKALELAGEPLTIMSRSWHQ
jgi:hypothetical protein